MYGAAVRAVASPQPVRPGFSGTKIKNAADIGEQRGRRTFSPRQKIFDAGRAARLPSLFHSSESDEPSFALK